MVIIIKKKTHNEFLEQINNINSNIEILSEYQKDNIKIHCKCKICGFEWNATPSNLLRGKGCKQCYYKNRAGKYHIKLHNDFVNELHDINKDIAVLDEYVNSYTKLRCKCTLHDEFFEITPHHLLEGKTGCKKCINIKNHLSGFKGNEKFIEELKKINADIIPIDEYIGANSKIRFLCKKCNHIWRTTPSSVLSAQTGCSKCCSTSKGENVIAKFLDDNNIKYELHKTFDGLCGLGGNKLSFDFYIEEYNILIEMQGRQHRMKVDLFGGEKQFETQKEHDIRKKNFAINNSYEFIEIWYDQIKQIDKILENKINDIKNPVTTTVV